MKSALILHGKRLKHKMAYRVTGMILSAVMAIHMLPVGGIPVYASKEPEERNCGEISTISAGAYTVKACSHPAANGTDQGNGTHELSCPDCGYTGTEPHNFGNTGICSGCNLQAAAKVEKDGAAAVYIEEDGLDAAFSDNNNAGATITLLKNVETENGFNIKIDCTLDLGGYVIHSSLTGVSIGAQRNVTIQGNGSVISEQQHALLVLGEATLMGGTFTSNGDEKFCGVYVAVTGAKLSVTSENVIISHPRSGYGLGIYIAESVRLSNGTYSGGTNAIMLADGINITLGDLLDRTGDVRYAYFNGTAPIAGMLDQKELPGTVTVKKCTHTGDGVCTYTHNAGSTTHRQDCSACGKKENAQACSFTDGKCICGATLEILLSGAEGLVYTGKAQEPAVTVTLNGQTLAKENYTVSYENNVNAGGDTASVIVSSTYFDGTVRKTFSIGKATPALAWSNDAQEMDYTGSEAAVAAPVASFGDNALVIGTDTGPCRYDYAVSGSDSYIPGLPVNAGTYTVRARVEAKGNYTAAQSGTMTLTIRKAPGTLTIPEKTISRTFGDAGFSLNCSADGDGKITFESDNTGVVSVSEDGKVRIKGAGEAVITVSLAEGTNHTAGGSQTVKVTVAKAASPTALKASKQYIYSKGSGGEMAVVDVAEKLPEDRGETAYTFVTSDDGRILSGVSVDRNGTLTYKVNTGMAGSTATVTVKASMANYEEAVFTLDVQLVEVIRVKITAQAENAVYNGSPQKGYADGITCDYPVAGYAFAYTGRGGTAYDSGQPPKDAGSYTVQIRVSDAGGDYEGSVSLDFIIEKAAITICADDKTAKRGEPLPELTYTVSGLAQADSLAAVPELACEADMKKAGVWPITVKGAKAPETGNYHTDITYQHGTLTVLDAPVPDTGGVTGGSTSGATGGSSGWGSVVTGSSRQNQPFLKDSSGREGWDVIRAAVQKAAAATDGGTVVVDMNGAVSVPGSVFAAIRGKDVTVCFEMGDGIVWSVKGTDITAETGASTDFSVKTGAGAIPDGLIDETAGGLAHLELSLAHEGAFGFTATLTLRIGSGNAGNAAGSGDMYANLFYYYPDLRVLEFVCAGQIKEDGTVSLPFVHASDYTVILSTYPMHGADTPQPPETGQPQEPEAAPAGQIKSVKLSKTVYTYTGKAKKPSVTVLDADGRQIPARYYTVSYKNNKKVGKATVTVRPEGGYSGTVTKTFTIRPAGTSIKKATAASDGFYVKWTKQTAQISGYQIQYSRNKKWKGNSTHSVFVKQPSKTKRTVKGLQAGKKYYVRIRTYKTVMAEGKSTRICSAWSGMVPVKIRSVKF